MTIQLSVIVGLKPVGKYKAAEARYTQIDEINREQLSMWLSKAIEIQWDYKIAKPLAYLPSQESKREHFGIKSFVEVMCHV